MMYSCSKSCRRQLLGKIASTLLIFLTIRLSYCENDRPVVGILSLPLDTEDGDDNYISASYVKWIESAGARSIPIPYDATDELVEEIFTQINGLLLPGGGSPSLPQSAKKIWELAIESNSRGDYFPVWGTCLGMEFMVALAGDTSLVQSGFNAKNISLPLIFPTNEDVVNSNGVFSIESMLYPQISQRQILSSANITMNNHVRGVKSKDFIAEKKVSSLFKITSTSVDRDGIPFISTIESFQMPLYGVQYHPEKHNFEYGLMLNDTSPYLAINHSEDAVTLSMHLAFFFVNRARKNVKRYSMLERHPFVYQYEIVTDYDQYFEQVYIIPSARKWIESSNGPDSITAEGRSELY